MIKPILFGIGSKPLGDSTTRTREGNGSEPSFHLLYTDGGSVSISFDQLKVTYFDLDKD